MSASTINQKIWNMATVLYNDGVSNSDYLEQLTYLLFLKMADEYSKPPLQQTDWSSGGLSLGVPCGKERRRAVRHL